MEVLGWSSERQQDSLQPFQLESIGTLLSREEARTFWEFVKSKPGEAYPFARFGWAADALGWLDDNEKTLNGSARIVEQVNASGSFALVRIRDLKDRTYWLKAVGAPNLSEYSNTQYLHEKYPEFLPKILSMRGDWHAWLMEEVGSSLYDQSVIAPHLRAAEGLARLQQRSVGSASEMIDAGLIDHRICTLSHYIDEIVDYLVEIMPRQVSTRVERLCSVRLKEIGVALHDALDHLGSLGVPDCLLHGDFSLGSVLSETERVVFTDWCEAYVGNPLITLEQFCAHLSKDPVRREWISAVRHKYFETWRDFPQAAHLPANRRRLRMLSILSSLYGRGSWFRSSRSHNPHMEGYARSLARHLDRAMREADFERSYEIQ
jgi:hypothetical protein